ncbi:MAG: M15 family metallopeptidase [Methylococcaceae bacterium]|jgi:D-alanyl-D-alanine carboxypeptidase
MTNTTDISSPILACWQKLGIDANTINMRGLPFFNEPEALLEAEVSRNGRIFMLTPAAASAWKAMKQAAETDSVAIYMISGFRSIARQAELVEAKLQQDQAIDTILSVLAPPGCSEHHTGRAVDIGAPGFAGLDVAFEESPAFCWLQANAQQFGYTLSFPRGNPWGYQYEPWHWCFKSLA